ncbi:hypothetical protein D1AOALGA4SA_1389 [Olavius algarvensis Delta 1 endosymbiont]|nr:hypothetical protein D1AOALGA4SA_1389 [Olavius algarvensis Delta 1 endosymbiont]
MIICFPCSIRPQALTHLEREFDLSFHPESFRFLTAFS